MALLRERLAVVGELEVMAADTTAFPGAELEAPDPRRYDARLEAAVKRFQRRHLLEPDGIVGRQTRAALNVPVERRIDEIRLNMERARWLLHGLPEAYVLVDIAGYRLSYFRPNGEVWRSRIVVGTPYRHTPSLRSEITHMTVNPTWTIPPTIRREDVLPRVREDLGYLIRENIRVLSPAGEPLDPREIDWANPGNVVLRQGPGRKMRLASWWCASPTTTWSTCTIRRPRACSHGSSERSAPAASGSRTSSNSVSCSPTIPVAAMRCGG